MSPEKFRVVRGTGPSYRHARRVVSRPCPNFSLNTQASGDDLDSMQATYNDLLQTQEKLREVIPNEQLKRRLEGESSFISQEWGEVFGREKSRVILGQVNDLLASLERKIEDLDKEWAEVNRRFSTQGYNEELHDRYQV